MTKYGKTIAKLRKERGMTQKELGNMLNVSYQAISKWENDLSEPDLESINSMSKIFNISISDFFELSTGESSGTSVTQSNSKTVGRGNWKNFFHKNLWYILIACLAVVTLVFGLVAICVQNTYSGNQIFKKTESSIFQVSAYRGNSFYDGGVGFFIDSHGTAISTYDIFDGCDNAEVKLANGKAYKIKKILGYDKDTNIVIFKVGISKSKGLKLGNSNKVKMADDIFALGFSSGKNAKRMLTEGVIWEKTYSDKGIAYFQSSSDVSNGDCGWAILNKNGKVIGITTGESSIGVSGFFNTILPINQVKKIKRDKNITLRNKAIDEYGTYTIVFDANGADGGYMPNQEVLRFSSVNLNKNKFYKTGHQFAGWKFRDSYIYADEREICGLSYSGGTITLLANWEPIIYTINYVLNGGINSPNNKQTYTCFDEEIVLSNPSRNGFEFLGWYENADFSGAKIEKFAAALLEEKTFYAKWNQSVFSVVYHLNDGVLEGENPSSYTVHDDITLKSPTKKGYTFLGWSERSDGGSYLKSLPIIPCRDLVLYAIFAPTEHTINYVTDGGELSVGESEVFYEISSKDISNRIPTKKGYKFLGWYDNEKFEGQPVTKIELGTEEDVTLYAKYEIIIYKISYKYGERDIEGVDNPYTYTVETPTITLNDAPALGVRFVDWRVDSWKGKIISKIEQGSTGDLVLHAYYSLIEERPYYYTISTPEGFYRLTLDDYYWRSENIRIVNDIDMSGWELTSSIGKSESSPFKGKIDGRGHTIKNLTAKNVSGVFGYISSEAAVKNIGFENVDFVGVGETSGFFAYVGKATIEKCFVQGKFQFNGASYYNKYSVGAFVGQLNEGGKISECYADIDMTFTRYLGKYFNDFGGFVGYNYSGIIQNCYSTGKMSVTALNNSVTATLYRDYVGGFVGDTLGTISNSYSTVDIIVKFDNIDNVVGDDYSFRVVVGGFAGKVNDNDPNGITNCFATGNISLDKEKPEKIAYVMIGGFVGKNKSESTGEGWQRFSGQILNNDYEVNEFGESLEMVDIWSGLPDNWDSNIWTIYPDKNPTLKVFEA